MRLEHAFTYTAAVLGPHVVGRGPFGLRHYYEMAQGFVHGPRLSGRTLGAGADWMLVDPDGVLRMDVRIQLLTDDGAVLCARYRGICEPSERMRSAMEHDEPTRFQDQRIRTCWELECGDPRYDWVNRCLFVGEARLEPAGANKPGFEHRVYQVN
ncbi:DUF3237 domain-containing protein [uncultured Methylobacterium sp.]|uniref:DUF3237 domain-containing protein n=1 Tax=uncultured Methylobacterium sp. TaxID=157278 RepID=UPI0035CAC2F6